MLSRLGDFSLWLLGSLTIWLSFASAWSVYQDHTQFYRLIPRWVSLTLFLAAVAVLSLALSFIHLDFSLVYVAAQTSRELPWIYRLPAFWGGHEGSMLLWVFLLQAWLWVLVVCAKQIPLPVKARVVSILSGLTALLTLFILLSSNPFVTFESIDVPNNGRDLNPFLQDLGFLWHPPTLYMGYVGLAMPFALSLSALWEGQCSSAYARFMKPWALVTWLFLTLGIVLGSLWAYRVLGWGGFWFWDPVENASLMPWLIVTALLHSIKVTEIQDQFKGWILLLSILGFALSLVGTFLVRSGILTSVHAFAIDPGRGILLLLIFAVTVGFAIAFAIWRYPLWTAEKLPLRFFSKAHFILMNQLLLCLMMGIVFLGSVYPLIFYSLGLGNLSVGAPYYNTVIAPCMMILLIMMGFSLQSTWHAQSHSHSQSVSQSVDWAYLIKKQSIYLGLSLVAVIVLGLLKSFIWSVSCMLFLGSWVILMTLEQVFVAIKHKKLGVVLGVATAHLGLVVTGFGIVISQAYGLEKQLRLSQSDQVTFGPYRLQMEGSQERSDSQGRSLEVRVLVEKEDKPDFKVRLTPSKQFFALREMGLSQPAIYTDLTSDLYLALGETLINAQQVETHIVRLYYKPCVRLIWIGGFMMVFGGVWVLLRRLILNK